MKKVILSSYGICAILAAVLLYGCSKDKDEDTPAKRILGLWNITRETEITKNKNTGMYSDTSYSDPIPAGIFTAEFKDNSKVYININDNSPSKDTLDWSFQNDAVLIIDGDYFNVSNFTNNHLITTHYYFDGTDSVKNMLEFNK
jgi:hypothetical protein